MRVAILGLLALLVGGATIFLAKNWLANERANNTAQTAAPQVPTTMVLVAATDMEPSHFVKEEDLRWQPWPDDNLAEAYILQDEGVPADFIGTVVRTAIGAGDPITASRVVRPGDRGFLAAVLSAGMRAVSVPVNETSGIAGLIFPGDHVDVILTHSVRQDTSAGVQMRQVSETVLTNVRVLAIDQNVSVESSAAAVGDTATLEVTPQEAEKVSVMMQIGRLSLSLRSLAEGESAPALSGNTYTTDTDVSSWIELPSEEVQAAPQREEPAPQITIVRGGRTSTSQTAQPAVAPQQEQSGEESTQQPGEAQSSAPENTLQ
ncbi:MAG: Flp pilus assembly protein CpaB [Alphaproteobacteria bacterium]